VSSAGSILLNPSISYLSPPKKGVIVSGCAYDFFTPGQHALPRCFSPNDFRVLRGERFVIQHGHTDAIWGMVCPRLRPQGPGGFIPPPTWRPQGPSQPNPTSLATTILRASWPQRRIVVARVAGWGRVGPCGRHAGSFI